LVFFYIFWSFDKGDFEKKGKNEGIKSIGWGEEEKQHEKRGKKSRKICNFFIKKLPLSFLKPGKI
jgi:hypothetical protein